MEHILNRQDMRAAETSEYETGNPTCCNFRMVRLRMHTRVPKFEGIRRKGEEDEQKSFSEKLRSRTEPGLLASQIF